ncbi:RAMP superfamily CRISPR-associated protein [Nocardia salmonicida]|uniref:RAMP superfamily CRISPR-associated protein n=1 Tax=Nocardia salmonicida TaxID=53431 RepID=UPI0037188A38
MSTRSAYDRSLAEFAGNGGLPPANDLLVLTAALTTTADLTIGDSSARDMLADIVVHRDPETAVPMIPATAQSGVLRHAIGARLGDEDAVVLFGEPAHIDHFDHPAALHPRDALARTGGPAVRLRTGNTVDPSTRSVHPGGLYTTETVPEGTVFDLLWQIWLPSGDDKPRTARILTALAAAGALLDNADLRFGQRTNAGRGAVRAGRWRARLLRLTTSPEDARTWFTTAYPDVATLTGGTVFPRVGAALEAVRPGDDASWPTSFGGAPERAATCTITGTLQVAEPLADTVVPATARTVPGDKPVDSGAAVKALLRATALRAVEFLALPTGSDDDHAQARRRGRDLVAALFGPHPAEPVRVPTASRIAVDEHALTGSHPIALNRVPINPLTRAPVSGRTGIGAVQAQYGGARPLTITVSRPSAVERGVLALVVKDLCAGLATLGGPHRRMLDPASVTFDFAGRTRTSWSAISADPDLARDVAALVAHIRGR